MTEAEEQLKNFLDLNSLKNFMQEPMLQISNSKMHRSCIDKLKQERATNYYS